MSNPSGQGTLLQGKNAIITGASRGFGRAIAARLRQEGACLLLVSRSLEALRDVQKDLGGCETAGVHIYAADLSHEGTPERIIDVAKALWPKLDIVVNNAAILGPIGIFEDNDWREWRNTIETNLLAPVALTRLALKWMRTGEDGTVINISGGGAAAPRPGFSAYASSKAALVRFTETIATEVADRGIRVNCIAPGVMNTGMVKQVLLAGRKVSGEREYDCALAAASQAEAIDRAVDLVVFLASPESRGITGRLISAVWDPWRGLGSRARELHDSDIYTLRRIIPSDRGKAWQ